MTPMLKNFLGLPSSLRYRTGNDDEPISFFSEALCSSLSFDLFLGFFSSSAISLLANGFAVFLYRGGRMRLVVNTAIMKEDGEAFLGEKSSFFPKRDFDIGDISKLAKTLSKRDRHFFECLSFLIAKKRIEIRIVTPKGKTGISHSKCGIFSDRANKVAFEGSCNFSRHAMLENIESISVYPDWKTGTKQWIDNIQGDFELAFSGLDSALTTLDAKEFKNSIVANFPPKEVEELLIQESEFERNASDIQLPPDVFEKSKVLLNQLISEPRFPFGSEPRDYQVKAFNNWKDNKQKGLFEMATGTGKTITALNCLLEIYKREKAYKAIILVPSKALAEQWEKECRAFNFKHIIQVSDNSSWQRELQNNKDLSDYGIGGLSSSFIVICTYQSFGKEGKFFELTSFSRKDLSRILLIADEAHNFGAPCLIKNMHRINFARRIGLSATPERQFQSEETKKLLEFFGAEKNSTFTYSMKEAIENGILCRYTYYPRIVNLTCEELEDYKEISKQIAKAAAISSSSSSTEGDSQNRNLELLLIKRKRIIHNAANKLDAFNEILQELYKRNGDLKHTFVYTPEGFTDTDDASSSRRLIDKFTRSVRDLNRDITVVQFTGESENREETIKKFADGTIQVLTSMKCLDEGVDVPQAKIAIFCASTGNPRQYIQRRGRILRKCADKKQAIIYDLVVDPDCLDATASELEKNIIKSELKRVYNFASLAENKYPILNEIILPMLRKYNVPLDVDHV